MVIITHDLTTLFTVCHRVGVLVDRKLTVGTVEALMASEHPWIRDFFGGPRGQGARAAWRQEHGSR